MGMGCDLDFRADLWRPGRLLELLSYTGVYEIWREASFCQTGVLKVSISRDWKTGSNLSDQNDYMILRCAGITKRLHDTPLRSKNSACNNEKFRWLTKLHALFSEGVYTALVDHIKGYARLATWMWNVNFEPYVCNQCLFLWGYASLPVHDSGDYSVYYYFLALMNIISLKVGCSWTSLLALFLLVCERKSHTLRFYDEDTVVLTNGNAISK